MKTGVVQASTIAANPGLKLTAEAYLDPTRHIDHKIAALKKTLAKTDAELKSLYLAREQILRAISK